jgi:SET domain-containing protein
MNVTYEVRESRIPNAGKGLFAIQPIRRLARIGYYTGKKLQSHEPATDTTYLMHRPAYYDRAKRAHVKAHLVDGSDLSNDMRWINNDRVHPNAIFKALSDGRLAAYALRDISPGEEILADYGYDV